jgi:hypothetical protein
MSNFKVNDKDKEKLGSLALTIKVQTDIFLADNEAFVTKGNKQAAKRARVASLNAAKAAKEYRAESMRILMPPSA